MQVSMAGDSTCLVSAKYSINKIDVILGLFRLSRDFPGCVCVRPNLLLCLECGLRHGERYKCVLAFGTVCSC